MAVIFGFSSLPASAVPKAGGYWAHFAEYMVLGALLFIALGFETAQSERALALAILVASIYGVTDELHQILVPGRLPEVADWGSDTLGALTGALMVLAALRLIARRRAAVASTKRTA